MCASPAARAALRAFCAYVRADVTRLPMPLHAAPSSRHQFPYPNQTLAHGGRRLLDVRQHRGAHVAARALRVREDVVQLPIALYARLLTPRVEERDVAAQRGALCLGQRRAVVPQRDEELQQVRLRGQRNQIMGRTATTSAMSLI